MGLSHQPTWKYEVGVAGRYLTTYIHTDNFSIGHLKGEGLDLWIEPGNDADFDGIVGPDMLRHFDLDLDFAHGKLGLFSPDHCPGKVVYWTKSGYVVVPMDSEGNDAHHIRISVAVDGKPVNAILDTGADTSVMTMRMANSLGVVEGAPELKLLRSWGPKGKYRFYSYPFHSLDFDGVTVTNPRIEIASMTRCEDWEVTWF